MASPYEKVNPLDTPSPPKLFQLKMVSELFELYTL